MVCCNIVYTKIKPFCSLVKTDVRAPADKSNRIEMIFLADLVGGCQWKDSRGAQVPIKMPKRVKPRFSRSIAIDYSGAETPDARSKARRERITMKSIRTMLKGLTHEDLREWAGSKIYNRAKEYVACVSQLSRTEDGTLVAWVSGSDEYATSVRHEGQGNFDCDCTCPYDWGPCKHAVAVLLAASERLKRNEEIPLLDPDDDLYLEAFEDDDDDWREDEDESAPDESPASAPKGRSPQIESMLAGKSSEELQTLLVDLALEFPDVARRIRDTAQLETGQIDKLVRSLRKEIRSLTAEDAWYNPWKEEGNLPDYSHVEQQFRVLLDKGYADAVFELGEELWKGGVEQVGQSHDEGETAMAIAACLEIVLQALPRTRLSPPEQLLWLVDCELEDEYDLLGGADAVLNDPRYTASHWREVAADLEEKLRQVGVPQSGRFSDTYRRKRVTNWLRNAYGRSGQQQKVIPLLEEEADRCRGYDALVEELLETGERDRARQWCIRGFGNTIEDAPGIAAGLQGRLRQMAEDEGRFDLSAAYLAEDFFGRPAEKTFVELRRAAEKADVWPAVRDGVLGYLQTGKRPTHGGKGKNAWPLPEPEVRKPQSHEKFRLESFPNREMLIEIALLEERHDDAVALYRELIKVRRWGWGIDERLAKAVAGSHPDVALHIWKSIADRLIGQVKPKAYQEAAGYLRRMREVYVGTGRLADWKALLTSLRVEHKAKRRLMEVLDGLEKNRKLVD